MDLDQDTLLIFSALTLVFVSSLFATTSALRHNDESNRQWTAGFAMAVCAMGLTAIYGAEGTIPTVVIAAITSSSVFSVGALWAGSRLLNGRSRSLGWVVLVVAAVVAVPTLAQGDLPNTDQSTILTLGLTGLFAWIAATEFMRGPLRRNLNSRILQLGLFAFGAWYVIAAAVTAAAAENPSISRPSTTGIVMSYTGLFILAAICLSALRVERTGNWWSMSAQASRRTNLQVLDAEAFRDDARDRIDRAAMTGAHVSLVLAEINDLDELNTAFGREAGDSSIVHFTGVLRSRVPASALIGHLGAGRFAILSVAATTAESTTIVAAIRTGLIDDRVDENMEIRSNASFGISQTSSTAPSLEALMSTANDDLESSRT